MAWYERLIDPLPREDVVRPPESVFAFYVHFIKPVKWLIAGVLVLSFFGSIIEMGAPGLHGLAGRLDDHHAAGAILRDLRPGAARHGVRGAVRAAGGGHPQPQPQQPDAGAGADGARALAELPLRAPPEPDVLPERLRRAHRAEGAADRPGAPRDRHHADRQHVDVRRLHPRHGRACSAGLDLRLLIPGRRVGRRLCAHRLSSSCRRSRRAPRRRRRRTRSSRAASSTATPTSSR